MSRLRVPGIGITKNAMDINRILLMLFINYCLKQFIFEYIVCLDEY